jgi:hypothetical protein
MDDGQWPLLQCAPLSQKCLLPTRIKCIHRSHNRIHVETLSSASSYSRITIPLTTPVSAHMHHHVFIL